MSKKQTVPQQIEELRSRVIPAVAKKKAPRLVQKKGSEIARRPFSCNLDEDLTRLFDAQLSLQGKFKQTAVEEALRLWLSEDESDPTSKVVPAGYVRMDVPEKYAGAVRSMIEALQAGDKR